MFIFIFFRASVDHLWVAINRDGSKKNLVLKPKAHGIGLTSELNRVLGNNVKNVFLYRHPVEYVKSVTAVYKSLLHPIVRSMSMKMSLKVIC